MELKKEKFIQRYTKVECEDSFKYNAPHHFVVKDVVNNNVLAQINFQEGPIKEVGVNGVANEDLLLMVVTRLEGFQNSEYRCNENQEAIDAIYEAVDALRKRTVNRAARGVEGTSKA